MKQSLHDEMVRNQHAEMLASLRRIEEHLGSAPSAAETAPSADPEPGTTPRPARGKSKATAEPAGA